MTARLERILATIEEREGSVAAFVHVDAEAARAAAGTLRCARPDWWVRSGVLNSAAAVEYSGGNQA